MLVSSKKASFLVKDRRAHRRRLPLYVPWHAKGVNDYKVVINGEIKSLDNSQIDPN